MTGQEMVLIGWIAHGMDEYRPGTYTTSPDKRKLPKIYRTEDIANRYGRARPVFVLKDDI